MDFISILGIVSTLCTTGAYLPQTLKIIKTNHTKSLSALTYTMISIGSALWVYYAVLRHDIPVIIANGVQGSLSLIILLMKLRNMGKHKETTKATT
ncbi:SemiSWEET family sugar transporter [Rhizosphaericola mali]|uniref:Glutathione synthetase n=1 Tax=Rhizosphaericola mali TaxID=2545455 RepID=A0A5P2G8B3_9BACT|nr:SemiSWEET family transporter [Rhizosphaericola mali]QES89463.1 hypothetical protein E0W69_012575 [Rhizosphaericola mali]